MRMNKNSVSPRGTLMTTKKITPYADGCKPILKFLGLKAKDFKIKALESRRYPGETYTWCTVQYRNYELKRSVDPHSGVLNTEMRYSYILNLLHEVTVAIGYDEPKECRHYKEAMLEVLNA